MDKRATIWQLYTNQHYSYRRISIATGIPKTTVARIIKGFISKKTVFNKSGTGGGYYLSGTDKLRDYPDSIKVRLHNIQWKLYIKFSQSTYKLLLSKWDTKKFLDFQGHKIQLGRKTINLYNKPNNDIIANDIQQAKAMLTKVYKPLFKLLQKELSILIKPTDYRNLVRCHIAEVNNELAIKANKEGDKLKVRGKDGKTWLLIDKSHGQNELECIHPTEAINDYEAIIAPYFEDLRHNPHYKPSELKGFVDTVLKVQEGYAEAITKHLQAVEDISTNTKGLREAISKDVKVYVERQLKQNRKVDKKTSEQKGLKRFF